MDKNLPMINKIFESTKGKPCSCPRWKICTGCKPKKAYSQSNVVQYVEKPNRWKSKTSSPLCKWYKRRKALKELIAENKKEQEFIIKGQREEYERERMRQLIEWEREQAKDRNKWRSSSLPPAKKEKIFIKERSVSAKPHARSKIVAVKHYNTRETFTRRYVNYCYRLCCQFYCYLTCIILTIFIVICII